MANMGALFAELYGTDDWGKYIWQARGRQGRPCTAAGAAGRGAAAFTRLPCMCVLSPQMRIDGDWLEDFDRLLLSATAPEVCA